MMRNSKQIIDLSKTGRFWLNSTSYYFIPKVGIVMRSSGNERVLTFNSARGMSGK